MEDPAYRYSALLLLMSCLAEVLKLRNSDTQGQSKSWHTGNHQACMFDLKSFFFSFSVILCYVQWGSLFLFIHGPWWMKCIWLIVMKLEGGSILSDKEKQSVQDLAYSWDLPLLIDNNWRWLFESCWYMLWVKICLKTQVWLFSHSLVEYSIISVIKLNYFFAYFTLQACFKKCYGFFSKCYYC